MSTAEIARLENAGRSAMAYPPEAVTEAETAASFLTASIAWSVGFIVIASAVLFAFS